MSTIPDINSEKKDTLVTNKVYKEKRKKRKKHNKKSKKQSNRTSLQKEENLFSVESNDSFGPGTKEKKRNYLNNNKKEKKSVNKNENQKKTFRKFLIFKLRKKYDAKTYLYNIKKVNELIFNIPSHFTASFKEYLLKEENSEFLKRFYYKNELKMKLHNIYNFYEKYSKIFPNYTVIHEGHYMYKNILKKQKMIDKLQRLKEQEKQNMLNLLNLSNDTVFTNGAIESIYNQKDSFYNVNLQNIIELDSKCPETVDILKIQEIIKIIGKYENLNEIKKLESLAKKQIIYKKEFRDLRDLSKSVDTHKNKNKKKTNINKNNIPNIQNLVLNNNNQNDSDNEKEKQKEIKWKKKITSDKKSNSKERKLFFISTKQRNFYLNDIKENSFEDEENNLAKSNMDTHKSNDKIILSPCINKRETNSNKKNSVKKIKKTRKKNFNDNNENEIVNLNSTNKKKNNNRNNNFVVTSIEFNNKNNKQQNDNNKTFKKTHYPMISDSNKKIFDSTINIISEKKEKNNHKFINTFHDRNSYSQNKNQNLTILTSNIPLYKKKVCNDTRGLSITKKNRNYDNTTFHIIDVTSFKRLSAANGGITPNYKYNINTKISNLDIEEKVNNDFDQGKLKRIYRNQTTQLNNFNLNNISCKNSKTNIEFKNTGVYKKKRGLDEDKSCPKKNKYLSLIDKDNLKLQQQKINMILNEENESSSEESSEEEEENEISLSYKSSNIFNGVVMSEKERNMLINSEIKKKDNVNFITNKKENVGRKNFREGTTKNKLKIDYS